MHATIFVGVGSAKNVFVFLKLKTRFTLYFLCFLFYKYACYNAELLTCIVSSKHAKLIARSVQYCILIITLLQL